MSKAIAFLAGLGTGYVNAQDKQRERERQDKLDQITFDRAARESRQADRDEQRQRDVAAASQDVQVTDAAGVTGLSTPGTETQYTNPSLAASDLRQSRTMAAATGTEAPPVSVAQKFAAGGTITASPGDAKRAADAQNTPEAKEARTIAAIAKYDPMAAKQYEAASVQTKAAHNALAEAQWKRDVGAAMSGGWEGMVALVNKSEAGPMAGVQLQAVPSADGKTVSFARVGPDGAAQPVPGLQFSNDQNGILQAAYMLDRSVSPGARLAHALAVAKEAREQGKSEAEVQELKAKAGYWSGVLENRKDLADAKGSADKPKKMDEDDKLRVKDADTRVRDAERLVAENMGKLSPGDDASKAPGVTYAQNMLKQARANQFKTHVELGLLTPERVAQDALSVAQGPADVLRSLHELANTVGTDFADKVAVKLQSMDQWKDMTKPAPPRAGPPQTEVGKNMAKAPPGSVRVVGNDVVAAPAATSPAALASRGLNMGRGNSPVRPPQYLQ